MKRSSSVLLLAVSIAAPALAADVGVSVTIGQPGFYGTIDIGNYPQPRLIYPQPVIIEQVRVVQPVAPIYLHVPPGHAKDWRKHCKKYDACGRPAYFVQDDWYNNVYVPEYRKQHGNSQGKGNGKGNGKGKGNN